MTKIFHATVVSMVCAMASVGCAAASDETPSASTDAGVTNEIGNDTSPLAPDAAHADGDDGTPHETSSDASHDAPIDAPPSVRPSMLPTSTLGRIGLAQVFDTSMMSSTATADAPLYDYVWASGSGCCATASDWRAGSATTVVSRYMVFGLDYNPISKHDLAWWQANHPEMILYACTKDGLPTKTPALEPGALPHDIGLDLENDAATDLEIEFVKGFMTSHPGYDALAIDQFITTTMYSGYNPSGDNGGETGDAGYYGCGVYADAKPGDPFGGTFKKEYTGKTDPKWFDDAIHYVARIKKDLGAGWYITINHPAGKVGDAREAALLDVVDGTLDEEGFGAYGKYVDNPGLFETALGYMVFAQSRGAATFVVDNYSDGTSPLTHDQLEWSMATYLLGNDGRADLFVSPNAGDFGANGYGAEHVYPEYSTVDAKLGTPCGPYSIPDATNKYVYARAYSGGFVVANAGSNKVGIASQTVKLPAKSYVDVAGKTVSSPLVVPSSQGFVLFTTPGTGCS